MKVEVITRHAITNYGSLLQAYATQTIIEKLGHECEIIDYIREDESYRNHEKTLLKKKPDWNNNILKKIIYLSIRQTESVLSGRRFEKERSKYLKLSDQYSTSQSLSDNVPKGDVYMTGSDQVWGTTEDGTYDSNYCLSFVHDVRKIAYSASFGHTEFNDELFEYFKKYLSDYDEIAVREDSAVNVIKKMGLETKQVLDPVFLLDRGFWVQNARNVKEKDYILVYQLHNNKVLDRYAKKISKKRGLPIIRVSPSFHQCLRGGKLKWCPDIARFLGYIMNAKLLITDSFHGTAFALLFNTQFVEVLPNNNTGTRNISILSLTGLTDRILSDQNIKVDEEVIDFNDVNDILANKREESIHILDSMITGKE